MKAVIPGVECHDEAAGLEVFDDLVQRAGIAKTLYREVNGFVFQPRLMTEYKPIIRIDRIVYPSNRLIEAGWVAGPFGVEAKKPGVEKIGKAVSQAMDYTKAAFEVSPSTMPGTRLTLEWVFLWPFHSVTGDLASVMAQNRIGVCWTSDGGRRRDITFVAQSGTYAVSWREGSAIRVNAPQCGGKRGSR